MHYRTNQKLAAKYFGPFKVIAKIDYTAYKLQLPSTAKIHNVFHVSQLKAFRGELPTVAVIPPWSDHIEEAHMIPAAVLDNRVVQDEGQPTEQYLVHWVGKPAHETTWVNKVDFEAQFPDFFP